MGHGTSLTRITGTGLVAARAVLGTITLTAGDAAAASLTVRSGGASGTVLIVIKCPQADTRVVSFAGEIDVTDLHATLSGASAEASFEV